MTSDTQTTSPFRAFSATIRGITPYSQSKMVTEPRKKGEEWDEYEQRIWKQKMHTAEVGKETVMVIPAAALSQSVTEFAAMKGEKIKGKGMKTWKKPFLTGVRVFTDVPTDVTVADVYSETNMCDSQGNKGSAGGSRVPRTFPCIAQGWTAKAVFLITDESIPIEKFTEYLTGAGYQIGIGRWRPQNGGSKGMFKVEEVVEVDPHAAMGL